MENKVEKHHQVSSGHSTRYKELFWCKGHVLYGGWLPGRVNCFILLACVGAVLVNNNYKIKATNPELGEQWSHGGVCGGGGWISGERATSTYDLVEQMQYLYVRVVRARDLPTNPVTGSCDPYVEAKLGNYKGRSQHFEKKTYPEWNQVFAFSKEKIQSVLEVFCEREGDGGRDDFEKKT